MKYAFPFFPNLVRLPIVSDQLMDVRTKVCYLLGVIDLIEIRKP